MNFSLQNPSGSLNQRCVQRFFLWDARNPVLTPGAINIAPSGVRYSFADSAKKQST